MAVVLLLAFLDVQNRLASLHFNLTAPQCNDLDVAQLEQVFLRRSYCAVWLALIQWKEHIHSSNVFLRSVLPPLVVCLCLPFLIWRIRVAYYNRAVLWRPGDKKLTSYYHFPKLDLTLHHWKSFRVASQPRYCTACRELVSGFFLFRNIGWECEICGIISHFSCIPSCERKCCKVPSQCLPMQHLLKVGNLSNNSACHVCGIVCSSSFSLVGVECLWCHRCFHPTCLEGARKLNLPSAVHCDLGVFASHLLPPTVICPVALTNRPKTPSLTSGSKPSTLKVVTDQDPSNTAESVADETRANIVSGTNLAKEPDYGWRQKIARGSKTFLLRHKQQHLDSRETLIRHSAGTAELQGGTHKQQLDPPMTTAGDFRVARSISVPNLSETQGGGGGAPARMMAIRDGVANSGTGTDPAHMGFENPRRLKEKKDSAERLRRGGMSPSACMEGRGESGLKHPESSSSPTHVVDVGYNADGINTPSRDWPASAERPSQIEANLARSSASVTDLGVLANRNRIFKKRGDTQDSSLEYEPPSARCKSGKVIEEKTKPTKKKGAKVTSKIEANPPENRLSPSRREKWTFKGCSEDLADHDLLSELYTVVEKLETIIGSIPLDHQPFEGEATATGDDDKANSTYTTAFFAAKSVLDEFAGRVMRIYRGLSLLLFELERFGSNPMVVFVNPKSGGQTGDMLLRVFYSLLNPLQVVNLAVEKTPTTALQQFRWLAMSGRMRVLACGGDGTASWLLNTIAETYVNIPSFSGLVEIFDICRRYKDATIHMGEPKMVAKLNGNLTPPARQFKSQLSDISGAILDATRGLSSCRPSRAKVPLAVLPLGTGNDLSRVLGWGFSFETSAENFLRRLVFGVQAEIDIWSIEASVTNVAVGSTASGKGGGGLERLSSLMGSSNAGAASTQRDQRKESPSMRDLLERQLTDRSPLRGRAARRHHHFRNLLGRKKSGGETVEQTNQLFQLPFVNYIDVGVAARIALKFHALRESHPELFKSRLGNRFLYGEVGIRDYLVDQPLDFSRVEIFCDGQAVKQPPPPIEGIVIVNIPSFGGGCNMWKLTKENNRPLQPQSRSSNHFEESSSSSTSNVEDHPRKVPIISGLSKEGDGFVPQSIDDGIIEVVAFKTEMHLFQMQVGLAEGFKICQGREIILKLDTPVPLQIDGEPRMLPTCDIKVNWKQKGSVLICPPQFGVAAAGTLPADVITKLRGGGGGAGSTGGGSAIGGDNTTLNMAQSSAGITEGLFVSVINKCATDGTISAGQRNALMACWLREKSKSDEVGFGDIL